MKVEFREIVANSNDIPEENVSKIIISKSNHSSSIIFEDKEIETMG